MRSASSFAASRDSTREGLLAMEFALRAGTRQRAVRPAEQSDRIPPDTGDQRPQREVLRHPVDRACDLQQQQGLAQRNVASSTASASISAISRIAGRVHCHRR
jgi:hypothetical protein